MFQGRLSSFVAILSLGQHDFNNFCNLSQIILKKGGLTSVLANHKKGILPLKSAFLCQIQRAVRRLSCPISSFRLKTYVQLTFMSHYRCHGFFLREISVRKAFQSYFFYFENAAMKTQHFANIWKTTLAPFAPSNYAPGKMDNINRVSSGEFRSRHQRYSIKKAVLKNFAILTGKHLCSSLFPLKAWRPTTLLKRDSSTGVFLWILRNF